MIKLKGVIEKIRGRKVIAAIVLVSIIAFSVVYALTQMKTGFAVLTTPPPGIPGPYYVTAEAKIYGPVVDLAAIKSKMGGTYASDYTYVQWGTNPFYRVYVDNTLQEVYYGTIMDVMDRLSWQFKVETDLNDTYNSLLNGGAIDPTSILGQFSYHGNIPGVFVCFFYDAGWGWQWRSEFNITTTSAYAAEAHARFIDGYYGQMDLKCNETLVLGFSGHMFAEFRDLNMTGWRDYLVWDVDTTGGLGRVSPVGVTLYLKDLTLLETQISETDLRIYEVTNSPGTGFVSKIVSPSSPLLGSTVNISDGFDPPAANNVNLTDLYPNTFGWTGSQVILEKYRVGVGIVATASLSVTPAPVDSNMEISITYDQAPSVLQSLLSDEYIHMRYTLTTPSTSGEYTLPAATMSYSIPLPQT